MGLCHDVASLGALQMLVESMETDVNVGMYVGSGSRQRNRSTG